MSCEFAYKKDGVIYCKCNNLARGTINGHPINVSSSLCLENLECYYKLYKKTKKSLIELSEEYDKLEKKLTEN